MPSRLRGWDQDIDHTKRHALVDRDGRVKWIIHPHVEGTINSDRGTVVDTVAGERIVEVTAFSRSDRDIYTKGEARVAADGTIEVDTEHRRDNMLVEINEGTQGALSEGYAHDGVIVSLSPNAIAKYTAARAMAGSLIYPYRFSSINDRAHVEIADAAEMEAFTGAVLGFYLGKLAEGDDFKSTMRGAGDVAAIDAERARDTRPRRGRG